MNHRRAPANKPPDVRSSQFAHDYALGYTDFEQDRLIRQAARIAPITELFFAKQVSDPASVSSILDRE